MVEYGVCPRPPAIRDDCRGEARQVEMRAPGRRTALVGLALGLVAAAMLLTWPAAGAPETRASAEPMEIYVDRQWVVVSMRTSFPESVTLSTPVIGAGEARKSGDLWPLDGVDHEGEDLDPVRLEAGTPVSLSGFLQPPCTGPSDLSLAVTVTRPDGDRVRHHFLPSNAEELAAAVREFCDQGPSVRARAYYWEPDGDAKATVTVMNPGPDAITVELPAYADEFVTWSSLKATVPADETSSYEIRGTDVDCEPGETPSWLGGRLLVDGEPFVIRAERGSWC